MARIVIKVGNDGSLDAYSSIKNLIDNDPEAKQRKWGIINALTVKHEPEYNKNGVRVVRVELNKKNPPKPKQECRDQMIINHILVPFTLIDGKYINQEVGKEITNEMLIGREHHIEGEDGILQLSWGDFHEWLNGTDNG